MPRKSCNTNSLLGSNGKMFMRRSWSRRLSPKLPRRRTHDILTRSSQHKPSLLRHPDKMTVWSRLTASGDPTSPSSPTLPVERPKRLSNIPPVPPSPLTPALHPTALSRPGPQPCVLPALSAEPAVGCNSHDLHVVFYRKEEIQDKTKITVVVVVWPLKTDHGDNTTLHFLVVMLYTEQASIHHNERGNAAMHKLGYCYKSMKFEKGLFTLSVYNESTNQAFQIENRHAVDQKHHVSRECVVVC